MHSINVRLVWYGMYSDVASPQLVGLSYRPLHDIYTIIFNKSFKISHIRIKLVNQCCFCNIKLAIWTD